MLSKRIIALILSLLLLAGCASQAGAAVPELLTPVSVQNDIFAVQRGRVARVDQHRATVRVESEGLFFRDNSLPFGGFEVVAGQAVRQGDVLARLDISQTEEQIDERRERITDLQAEHNFRNQQMEREISIAQLELLRINQQIAESADSPEDYLFEAADIKRLEIQRRQMDLQQAKDWQNFALSYYQSDLDDMLSRLPNAELRAPFDGIITYRAAVHQGSWLESFRSIIFISDGQNMFVEYTEPTQPTIFRDSTAQAVIGSRIYELERIILPPSEVMFYTRAGSPPPFRFAFATPPDEYVRPGQFVALRIYGGVAEDVIRIPPNAMFHDTEMGHYVNLMENGQRIMQPIEPGLRTRAWVEVRSGLLEGDEIIVQQ